MRHLLSGTFTPADFHPRWHLSVVKPLATSTCVPYAGVSVVGKKLWNGGEIPTPTTVPSMGLNGQKRLLVDETKMLGTADGGSEEFEGGVEGPALSVRQARRCVLDQLQREVADAVAILGSGAFGAEEMMEAGASLASTIKQCVEDRKQQLRAYGGRGTLVMANAGTAAGPMNGIAGVFGTGDNHVRHELRHSNVGYVHGSNHSRDAKRSRFDDTDSEEGGGTGA
jgi:hypothetical protein